MVLFMVLAMYGFTGLLPSTRPKRNGPTARFRRCFAGVSQVFRRSFTDSRKQIHLTCFAAVSQVFREIHDVKHVSRIRGDVSRIRGDSRVFRGCFADSRKKIHVFRGCFTAVSHCEYVQ